MATKLLYICSEATHGMIPFAANIIQAASQSAALDVFAITVDDHRMSYRPFLRNIRPEKIYFLQSPARRSDKYLNKFYARMIAKKAKEICRDHHIDVVHFLTGDYTCHLIVPTLQKSATVFYTVHDLIPHEKALHKLKDRLFNVYLQWGEKRMLKQAETLVTCSKNQHTALAQLYPQKKVLYHPFPSLITDACINGTKTCPELKEVGKYILFFGNIDIYKGVEFLYNAFKMNANLSEYKLVIAGCGPIYFPQDPDARVLFINRYIEDDEVKSLFKNASCVVYPYRSATQSGVLAFAYKFRTPALVSDIPFFKECVTDNSGLFFKCGDTADLSVQLETLLFRTDIEKMKATQEKVYDTLYSEKALISALETMYTA